jgi:hypothetical protein
VCDGLKKIQCENRSNDDGEESAKNKLEEGTEVEFELP